MAIASDLPIDTDATAMDMANAMFGTGINVLNASYQDAGHASGIYSGGDSTAPGVTPSDSGVILPTGRATDITDSSGDANTSSGTFNSNFTVGDDEIEAQLGQKVEADLLANDESAAGGTLTITALNGQPVEVGDTVVLPSGEVTTLTPTGIVLAANAKAPGESTFCYEVSDEGGNTDIGFVTLTTSPCFVAGTLIDTPRGLVPVEMLRSGDMVRTRDHGAQPLRWLGPSTRRAAGADAPVRLAPGALGPHDALEVSPNHRVMIADATAELFSPRPRCSCAETGSGAKAITPARK